MAKKKSSKKKTTAVKKTTVNKGDVPDLSFLPIWAKKFKVDFDELSNVLEKNAEELRTRHAGNPRWTEKKIYSTARMRLRSEYMAQAKSSAIPFITNVLYATQPYDYGNKRYMANLQAYNTNPTQAQKNGLILIKKSGGKVTDQIPIDERKLTSSGKENKNFGKPLPEHAYIMTIGGIAAPLSSIEKENWDHIRPFEMTVSRQYADPNHKQYIGRGFNFGEWYKCKVTNSTPSEVKEAWKLNATSVTKWDSYDGIELDMEEIPIYFKQFYCELGDLQEYHDSYMEISITGTYQNNRRLVVTEGSVIDIAFSEDGIKNHRIVIDDESLGFMEEGEDSFVESVNCWCNPNIVIDFGKYSRILIFGSTGASLKKDIATGEVLEEFNSPSITIQGIVVLDRTEPDIEFEEGGDENDEVESEPADTEEPDLNEISGSSDSSTTTDNDVW
jgi:hypothetical protein